MVYYLSVCLDMSSFTVQMIHYILRWGFVRFSFLLVCVEIVHLRFELLFITFFRWRLKMGTSYFFLGLVHFEVSMDFFFILGMTIENGYITLVCINWLCFVFNGIKVHILILKCFITFLTWKLQVGVIVFVLL